jgi:hypothetical protein
MRERIGSGTRASVYADSLSALLGRRVDLCTFAGLSRPFLVEKLERILR